jgi:hypothetical protein
VPSRFWPSAPSGMTMAETSRMVMLPISSLSIVTGAARVVPFAVCTPTV